MELVVYIAIMGIIVIVAGQAFSNSTKFRVRNQSMIEANEVARNIASLIKDDIAQMGAKSSMETKSSTFTADKFKVVSNVFMDAGNTEESKRDSSSFSITEKSGFDSLALRRISYADTGIYQRVEEVSWYVKNKTLYRSCKTLDGTADTSVCPNKTAKEVEIATGVNKFSVVPSKPSVLGNTGLVFPKYSDLSNKKFKLISRFGDDNLARVTVNPESGGDYVGLSGFITNFQENGTIPDDPVKHQLYAALAEGTNTSWNNCTRIPIKKDSTYEISFVLSFAEDESRMFQPGADHFAVGIRKVDGTDVEVAPSIQDFLVYPPENDKGVATRTVKFKSSEDDFEGCIVFTLALFSPTVNLGRITIDGLKMSRVGDMEYVFDKTYSPQVIDKKNVRAMQIEFSVEKNGEAGKNIIVIPVPSNGTQG